jgi:hypothetical protein
MILPYEQELIDAGTTTLEALVAQYRVLFHVCWEALTAEQQEQVNEALRLAGLFPQEGIDG